MWPIWGKRKTCVNKKAKFLEDKGHRMITFSWNIEELREWEVNGCS
jgi:hypothetical protein